jgi:hypothetical protein
MSGWGKILLIGLLGAAVVVGGAVVAWRLIVPKSRPGVTRRFTRKPGPVKAGTRGGRSSPVARPRPAPRPEPVRLTVSSAAARRLPAGPVLFVSLEGLDATVGAIEASKWWRSIWSRLIRHPIFARQFNRFLQTYRDHLGGRDFAADFKFWRRLLGRQVCLAVYVRASASGSRRRRISYALAFTGPEGQSPDQILDRIKDFLAAVLKVQFTWRQAGTGSIKTLAGPVAKLHFAVTGDRLLVMSNDPDLLAGMSRPGSDQAAGRLAADKRYRSLVRAGPGDKRLAMFMRLDRLLPFLVGTLRGDDIEVRLVRSIKSAQLTSNGILTRLTLFFRPGAITSVFGPRTVSSRLTTTDLLPGSPLLYFGLSGPRWVDLWRRWQWESRLGLPRRGGIDRTIQRLLGLPGLDPLLELLDNEAAGAVMGLASGGLPRGVAFVRMTSPVVARVRLPWLVETLKKGPLGGEMLWRTHQAGQARIDYVIAPVIGTLGAADSGPYLVFSNDLKILTDLLSSRRGETTLFWGQLRSRKQVNLLVGADVARILDLAPGLLHQLGPVFKAGGRAAWPAWLLTAVDWFKVVRAVVAWARWDARRRALSFGLRLWLADYQVKRELPGAGRAAAGAAKKGR